MKATELMIGDWVKLKTDDSSFHKVHISALSFEFLWGLIDDDEANDAIGYNYLEPIPLTAEILERSGFIRESEPPLHKGEIMYRLFWEEQAYQENVAVWYVIKENAFLAEAKSTNRHYFGTIHYVHELQHALKLCGIEKEIEL